MESLKKFKVLGITTDFTICDCCGKSNLTKTVSILDLDHGVTNHFGVVCAASVEKYDSLEAAKAAKKEIDKAVRNHSEQVKQWGRHLFLILKKKYGVTVKTQGGYSVVLNCDNSTYEINWAAYLQSNDKRNFEAI